MCDARGSASAAVCFGRVGVDVSLNGSARGLTCQIVDASKDFPARVATLLDFGAHPSAAWPRSATSTALPILQLKRLGAAPEAPGRVGDRAGPGPIAGAGEHGGELEDRRQGVARHAGVEAGRRLHRAVEAEEGVVLRLLRAGHRRLDRRLVELVEGDVVGRAVLVAAVLFVGVVARIAEDDAEHRGRPGGEVDVSRRRPAADPERGMADAAGKVRRPEIRLDGHCSIPCPTRPLTVRSPPHPRAGYPAGAGAEGGASRQGCGG